MWDRFRYASATSLLVLSMSCGEQKKEVPRKTPETRYEQISQEFQEAHEIKGIEGIIARSKAYNNFGEYYAEQERYEEAINSYKQSMNIGGETAEAYQGIANVQYLKGDKTQAVHLARKALKINPEYAPAKDFLEQINNNIKK